MREHLEVGEGVPVRDEAERERARVGERRDREGLVRESPTREVRSSRGTRRVPKQLSAADVETLIASVSDGDAWPLEKRKSFNSRASPPKWMIARSRRCLPAIANSASATALLQTSRGPAMLPELSTANTIGPRPCGSWPTRS